ncbi:hypothetical protein C2S52_019090 [Perilla frutescens var. hirtella]|nr:hypothetical protein C2S52_019090 [Perilla frutescens var. hirtella]
MGSSWAWASSSVNVANFVTVKPGLKGKRDDVTTNFKIWKEQMLCLLESQDVVGFVDGGILQPPPLEKGGGDSSDEQKQWRRIDRLVKGWILGSLGKDVLDAVWEKQTSREVWYLAVYQAALRGDWETATQFFQDVKELSTTIITSSSETALHLAVLTGKANDFVKKLVELTPPDTLLALKDSSGRTALHNAAIVGNTEAAIALVRKNPGLLHISSNDQNRLAVQMAAIYCQKETVEYLISEHEKHNNPPLFEGQLGVRLLNALISSRFVDDMEY